MVIYIFSYIPHPNSVYYDIYNFYVFDCISNDVHDFSENGSVIIVGDPNSRIGNLLDYIKTYQVADSKLDILSQVFTYNADTVMTKRVTEDTTVNSFGRQLINLCKNNGMRFCTGRVLGNQNGRITFSII